jgi:hypothetical protein
MTTDPVIRQLTEEHHNMTHQIANREKEIAYINKRLKDSLMPNQIALLQAQRTRQVTMLNLDQGTLVNLEKLLAAEIANRSNP